MDHTLYTPDPHAEFPCSTIRKSSNCENGGKKCWKDVNQNGNQELPHSSQNWEFPAAYSGHRPWVLAWYFLNIQTAVFKHTFSSGASQPYNTTCHLHVHSLWCKLMHILKSIYTCTYGVYIKNLLPMGCWLSKCGTCFLNTIYLIASRTAIYLKIKDKVSDLVACFNA